MSECVSTAESDDVDFRSIDRELDARCDARRWPASFQLKFGRVVAALVSSETLYEKITAMVILNISKSRSCTTTHTVACTKVGQMVSLYACMIKATQ